MKPSANPSSQDAAPGALMPLPKVWALLVLNWLIPGVGFWLCHRRARALLQCLLVLLTFGLGIALHGGVDWPSWSMDAPDFNLINNFTFLIQLFAGLPALLSLLGSQIQNGLGVPSVLHFLFWHFPVSLGGTPTHPYYELGGYYMIVAGAVNYFATCNLYDRLLRLHPRFAEQESPEAADASMEEPS